MIWDTWYMPHGIMVYGKWYMVYGPLPLPHIHHSHEKCIGITIPTLKDFTGILIASFKEWKNSTFHPGAMLWNHHPHLQRINMDIPQCLTLALTRTRVVEFPVLLGRIQEKCSSLPSRNEWLSSFPLLSDAWNIRPHSCEINSEVGMPPPSS